MVCRVFPIVGVALAAASPTTTPSDPYRRLIVDIPMRDGVTLHTVILTPASAHRAPILLTRTPYDAERIGRDLTASGATADPAGWGGDIAAAGYVRVVQDIRGVGRSGGRLIVTRPLAGTPPNPGPTDEASDAYDTVDWLVRHVADTNGRVAVIGTSYDGFTTLMGLVRPHPAVKTAVAINPMVDGWRGDDWFRNGAFRQLMLPAIWSDGGRDPERFPWGDPDPGAALLKDGSVGAFAARRGLNAVPFWRALLAHPAYDSYWRAQAVDRVLATHWPAVPLMLVHALWDQEDIGGALSVWRALRPSPLTYLSVGPWRHAQALGDGRTLGSLDWGEDTAAWWRRQVLAPFLADSLAGRPIGVARVTAFRSGGGGWQRQADWPARTTPRAVYLTADKSLQFAPAGPRGSIGYVTDPARPVPYKAASDWGDWLAEDQRFAAARSDVVTFVSPPLDRALTVAGTPLVHFAAATSGSDADWVVKLIDVQPGEGAAAQGAMLPVSMTIVRGRYRADPARATPLRPGVVERYRIAMPDVSHVFRPGHRIAVQVQSSWFPLYDRNPQTFVRSIFTAPPSAYRIARQRIAVGGPDGSRIELPVTEPFDPIANGDRS